MVAPIFKGFEQSDDQLVADELQYYLNCSTCRTMVNHVREAPNDKIVADLFGTVLGNACRDFVDPVSCDQIFELQRESFMQSAFDLLITEDYICNYLLPLCTDEAEIKDYQGLSAKEYALRVLEDKPESIKNDDFLDKLYEQIEVETK
jgi:hypothetical protein